MLPSLRQDIVAAFPLSPVPAAHTIFESDDEGAIDAFGAKRWNDIPRKVAAYHEIALVAFSPSGFAYYLPAFMLAALEQCRSSVAERTVEALCPPRNDPARPSFARRWNVLTVEQRTVVVAFLRQFDDPSMNSVAAAVSALEHAIKRA